MPGALAGMIAESRLMGGLSGDSLRHVSCHERGEVFQSPSRSRAGRKSSGSLSNLSLDEPLAFRLPCAFLGVLLANDCRNVHRGDTMRR